MTDEDLPGSVCHCSGQFRLERLDNRRINDASAIVQRPPLEGATASCSAGGDGAGPQRIPRPGCGRPGEVRTSVRYRQRPGSFGQGIWVDGRGTKRVVTEGPSVERPVLSDDDFDTTIAWLRAHWSRDQCPFHAGNTTWEVSGSLSEIPAFTDGQRGKHREVFPVVIVTCGICGFTVPVNAIKIGLVKKDPDGDEGSHSDQPVDRKAAT